MSHHQESQCMRKSWTSRILLSNKSFEILKSLTLLTVLKKTNLKLYSERFHTRLSIKPNYTSVNMILYILIKTSITRHTQRVSYYMHKKTIKCTKIWNNVKSAHTNNDWKWFQIQTVVQIENRLRQLLLFLLL